MDVVLFEIAVFAIGIALIVIGDKYGRKNGFSYLSSINVLIIVFLGYFIVLAGFVFLAFLLN